MLTRGIFVLWRMEESEFPDKTWTYSDEGQVIRSHNLWPLGHEYNTQYEFIPYKL